MLKHLAILTVALTILGVVGTATATAGPLTPSSKGFVTVWDVAGPFATPPLPPVIPKGSTTEVIISKGPYVDLNPGKDLPKAATMCAATTIHLVADQALFLKVGADGLARVAIDGILVAELDTPYGALYDDVWVPTTLTAGAHQISLCMTKTAASKKARHRFALRIHTTDSVVPEGLTTSVAGTLPSTGALLADALTVSTVPTITPSGQTLTISFAAKGSLPSAAATLPCEVVTIPAKAKKGTTPSVIGTPSLALPPLATDGVSSLEVPFAPPTSGWYTMTLTCEGEELATEPLVFREGYQTKWLDVASKLEDIEASSKLSQGVVSSLAAELASIHDLLVDPTYSGAGGKALGVLEDMVTTAVTGKDPYAKKTGFYLRAYVSPHDGTLQRYGLYVPPSYATSGKKRYPLIVALHALRSSPLMALYRVLGEDPKGSPAFSRGIVGKLPALGDQTSPPEAIIVAPWGYGDSGFRFMGEEDVLTVMDEVAASYRTSSSKVSLTGISLGGLGTYHMGMHYPDEFAALGPVCGLSSVKLYASVRPFDKTWFEKVLVQAKDATSYAKNGKLLPMYVVHGKKDGLRHAKAMTNKYAKLGYEVTLETPNDGHHVWDDAYGPFDMLDKLLEHKKPSRPASVVFTTGTARYTGAFWLHATSFTTSTAFATITGTVGAAKKRRIVDVTASNVDGLSLLTKGMPLDGSKPLDVYVKGSKIGTVDAPLPETIEVSKAASGWTIGPLPPSSTLVKRPGLSGPMEDVWYDPVIIVVGTSNDAATTVNRELAEELSGFRPGTDIALPVMDDTAITPALMASHHLVLVGGPSDNSVTASMAGSLPCTFGDGSLTWGGETFEGDDVGVAFVHPNPLEPTKYVLVIAGTTAKATQTYRYLPRYLPDFVVYDDGMRARYKEYLLVDREPLAAGFFTQSWTIPPAE